jgi:hypothetical protein
MKAAVVGLPSDAREIDSSGGQNALSAADMPVERSLLPGGAGLPAIRISLI